MVESFYNLLGALGFHHPLHPLLVHIPMGMVIGAVAFSLAAFIWPDKHLDRTAFHCIVLALIAVVPVYIAGLLDWQHVFGGEMNKWIIIKMILGVVLAIILIVAVVQKNRGASSKQLLVIYLIALGTCGGLGFSGGQLLFGG